MVAPTAGDSRVLVLDATGRGHAICDLFIRTNQTVTVYYGPGCDVLAARRVIPVPSMSLKSAGSVLAFLQRQPVEFVFISHIDALARGFVDILRKAGHRVIGPTASAAGLEVSKARGRRFCVAHGIRVPRSREFVDAAAAKAYIRTLPWRCVVKTDGLTTDGDGAVVCDSVDEAHAAVDRFIEAGATKLVVEERLTGVELSMFALVDTSGQALMLPPAQDYKRSLDGDRGKNCDGMGSVAPHPADCPALRARLQAEILTPLLRGLRAEGLEFSGFLYVGVVLTADGPTVLEINARFGDSEAQVVLPGIQNDFLALCRSVLAGRVSQARLVTDGRARCSVALVQGCLDPNDPQEPAGWPFGEFTAGQPVSGLESVDPREAAVFLANMRRDESGQPVTSGGRVLHVVGNGSTPAVARERAYRQLSRISFAGVRYRVDIGAGPSPPPSPSAVGLAAQGAAALAERGSAT